MNFLRMGIRTLKAKSLYILLFLIVGLAVFFMFKVFYKKVDVSATLETQKQEVKSEMTLSFVGDLLMHTPVRKSGYDSKTNKHNFNSFFTDVKPFLENRDFCIGSLESPIVKKDADKYYSGYPVFNNPPEFIEATKNMGVDAVVTANNHSLDQGSKGVAETLSWIDKYNLPHTGTYNSAEERSGRPIIFYEKNGIKIAVANYTEMTNGISGASYAINYIDTKKIKQDIDFARASNADTVIVWLHFGNEYQRKQSENQKKIVNEVAKLGADIIIGSHPHVIQPIEVINVDGRKVFVAYAIGNFISNQYWRYSTDGMILNIDLEKIDGKTTFKNINYIPTAVIREYNGPETKNEAAVKQSDKSSDFITGAVTKGTIDGSLVKFRVVPVGQAMYDYQNKIDTHLTDKDYIRLKTTWEDTTGLIGGSLDFKVYRDSKTNSLSIPKKQ